MLAAIVELAEDAIVGKTLGGIVTSWNNAAERIFGYGAAEMVGQPIALLAAPETADEMPRISRRSVAASASSITRPAAGARTATSSTWR